MVNMSIKIYLSRAAAHSFIVSSHYLALLAQCVTCSLVTFSMCYLLSALLAQCVTCPLRYILTALHALCVTCLLRYLLNALPVYGKEANKHRHHANDGPVVSPTCDTY